jgi:hypothetical protein
MDIRRCTKEELDQINERARLWKQRQSQPEIHPEGERVNQPETEEKLIRQPVQLDLPIEENSK